MKSEQTSAKGNKEVSRRELLRTASLATVAAAVPLTVACENKNEPPNPVPLNAAALKKVPAFCYGNTAANIYPLTEDPGTPMTIYALLAVWLLLTTDRTWLQIPPGTWDSKAIGGLVNLQSTCVDQILAEMNKDTTGAFAAVRSHFQNVAQHFAPTYTGIECPKTANSTLVTAIANLVNLP